MRLHFYLSFRPYVRMSHFHFFPIPAVASQYGTDESSLACVKSEKYAFWVTISPKWECCCRGKAEVRIIDFKTTWSEFQNSLALASSVLTTQILHLELIA